jgi:hypothetical protein
VLFFGSFKKLLDEQPHSATKGRRSMSTNLPVNFLVLTCPLSEVLLTSISQPPEAELSVLLLVH